MRDYSHLLLLANRFQKMHNSRGLIPVPIEIILDGRLGFSIQPMEGLSKAVPPLKSYLAWEERTIVVDEAIYSEGAADYFLCLAHEFAHFVIHWPHRTPVKTVQEWMQQYLDKPEEQYKREEWESHTLAGLYLVPTQRLIQYFDAQNRRLREKYRLTKESSPDQWKKDMCSRLAANFMVPVSLVVERTEKEHLWD